MMFGRKNKKLIAYQRAIVEQHYREVEDMYRKMRAWRHDFHNHMQVLSAYLESGNIDSAKEYLKEINHNLQTVDTVIKTGNTMVDAILNSKISIMNTLGIKVDATAHVPAEIAVADIDQCIIIGNLLDNAMEACVKLEECDRFVRIYINVKNKTHLYMSFTNSAGIKQSKSGNIFLSTKGKEGGLGLYRVDGLISKYNGYLTRASEDGGFTTEVILPIE